jgi:hypothetical protein
MDAVFGGDYAPHLLAWEIRRQRASDLYMDLFREDRGHVLRLVDDDGFDRQPIIDRETSEYAEESAANLFMNIFNRFPKWAKSKWAFLNGAMSGGDCCDRCMVVMNLLNSSQPGCCDICEREMAEQMARNSDVVFAFERGGLRAVA